MEGQSYVRSRATAGRIATVGIDALRRYHPSLARAEVSVVASDGSVVSAIFNKKNPWRGGSIAKEAKRMKQVFPNAEVSVHNPEEGFAEIRIMKKGLRKGTHW